MYSVGQHHAFARVMYRSVHAAAAAALAVILAACGVQGSYTNTLPAATEVGDPRSIQGVRHVGEFADIEPVTTTPKPALPVELTDADGYEVVVEDTSRILALDLYGTYTKTLTGLGLAPNIIGRTVSSTETVLADLPVVTQGGHNINVEAVLDLRPSLVIVDHSIGPREAIDQIRAAGVPTVVMQPERTIASVAQDIEQLGAVVGLPQEAEKLAQRSVEEIERDMSAIKEIAPADPLRVIFLYARGNGGVFFIMGEGTGAKDLIEGVGAVDLASEHNLSYAEPANAEALAKLNPEAIIMMSGGLESTGGIEGLLRRPGIAQTIAGQNQRIITIPDGQSLAFGPLTGQTLIELAKALYAPDQA